MSAVRLLVTDVSAGAFVERVLKNPVTEQFQILTPEAEDEEALLSVVPDADAILCYKANLPGSVIRAGDSLRFIQKHGLNCKNIDVAAAAERNIPVGTQVLLRSMTVAEQAMAIMLACARKVVPGHRAVSGADYVGMDVEPIRTSQWNFKSNWVQIEGMNELFGTKVGIIGLGDIGMEIAKRCLAFGMEIYYYQRSAHSKDVEATFEASYLPLNELLAAADYLVLSLPHTPESEGLIGSAQLDRLKREATLINVARGAIVDENALVEALRGGGIAMAGLDVYQMEPLPEFSPLRELPNVVLLPHTGGGSYRAWDIDIPASLNNVWRFFEG